MKIAVGEIRLSDAVAGLVGIECDVVSGVFNLESSGLEAPDWRPRHDKHNHEAVLFAANGGDVKSRAIVTP